MAATPALVSLSHFQAADRAVLVLRHAEREPIPDPLRPELAELTPAGMRAARELGARLGGFTHLRLFHSPVKRCRQTAECIIEGLSGLGPRVEGPSPVESLGLGYIRGPHEVAVLTREHGDHFIRLWFEGKVDTRFMQDPRELARQMRGHMDECLGQQVAHGRRLDIHVTHDWNLLVLREWNLGLRHEEEGWIEFLDGLAYAPGHGGQLLAACGQAHGPVHKP